MGARFYLTVHHEYFEPLCDEYDSNHRTLLAYASNPRYFKYSDTPRIIADASWNMKTLSYESGALFTRALLIDNAIKP